MHDLMLLSGFLMLLQSTSLLMLMLFMQHTISIDCNRTYEDVYKCCQLKYLHTKAAASLKQFCTLLGVCYHDKQKTSVTLATESSMYVWSRTQKLLPYLLLVIMRLNHGISSCLLQLQRKTELAL